MGRKTKKAAKGGSGGGNRSGGMLDLDSRCMTLMKSMGHFDTESPNECDHGKQALLDNSGKDLVALSELYCEYRVKYTEMGYPDGYANIKFLEEKKDKVDEDFVKFALVDATNQVLRAYAVESMNLLNTIESPQEVTKYIRDHLPCKCLGGNAKKEVKLSSEKANCLECYRCKKKGTPKEFMRCSRCKQTTYCGRECQLKDWPDHKIPCKASQGKALSKEEIDKHVEWASKRDWNAGPRDEEAMDKMMEMAKTLGLHPNK
ncbi:MAG: hypothetical protein SGARI_005249 [Bacillariaceae sp.]